MELITYTLSICQEKQLNYGEDSLMCHTCTPNVAIIACMDGCGGSGGCRYPDFGNWSGARIASRLVGQAVSDWFIEETTDKEPMYQSAIEALAEEMADALKRRLKFAKEQLPENDSVVMSKLARVLPSTLAAITVEAVEKNLCRIGSFWAGDSRTYFFPVSGLQQTSRDNIRGNADPFESLIRDGIMNNVICADKDFHICTTENWTREPCMVITATDGCFSYFPSPMYFEWMLLETLEQAKSPLDWEDKIRNVIGSVAGDDYAMQIAVVGFSNFKALQTAYTPRYEVFQNKYAKPLLKILEEGNQEAHYKLWLEYKQSYMLEN